MKKQIINTHTVGLGPIVCMIIPGNNPNDKGFDGNLPDEENLDQDNSIENSDPEINPIEEEEIIPEGEEQNIPQTEDTPEIEQTEESEDSGVTPDIIDIPRSTPSRSRDTIGPDHEPQVI